MTADMNNQNIKIDKQANDIKCLKRTISDQNKTISDQNIRIDSLKGTISDQNIKIESFRGTISDQIIRIDSLEGSISDQKIIIDNQGEYINFLITDYVSKIHKIHIRELFTKSRKSFLESVKNWR